MTSSSDSGDDVRVLRSRLSETEAKAARLEQWLDGLVESSPVPTCIMSTFENRVLRVNSALAELYGMTAEEILSADPFTLALRVTHPDDLVAEQKLFAELAIGARRSYQFEKRYVRPDGSHCWGLLSFSAIFEHAFDEGSPLGPIHFVLVQVIDINEQKLLADSLARREEELRHAQKIDGIGRLAAGVAHDFNNLLTVIVGHGEVLKARVDADFGALSARDVREHLEAILSASDRAAGLTAQLLAHGRREPVARRILVLSEVVHSSQRLLGRSIESNIGVELSLPALGSIFADPGQISQIVMNLLLNARDAVSERGHIQIATRDVSLSADGAVGSPKGPGEWVALSVSDDGHGMSPEVRARIFEPFFTTRADRPGTRGTGLGLATVQRIVAEHGGRIDVTSAEGKGTQITVFFPRTESAPSQTEAARPSADPTRAPNTQRVLVVEDEPAVRSLIATVLLGAHYRVAVARHGEEALQFIEAAAEPFHLIVTDLVMPGIGGVALAKRLHERADKPRMLFISGYSSHGQSELSPHGVLLPKPFTPAQLLEAVLVALKDTLPVL